MNPAGSRSLLQLGGSQGYAQHRGRLGRRIPIPRDCTPVRNTDGDPIGSRRTFHTKMSALVARKIGIKLLFTSASHPRTNGLTERANGVLGIFSLLLYSLLGRGFSGDQDRLAATGCDGTSDTIRNVAEWCEHCDILRRLSIVSVIALIVEFAGIASTTTASTTTATRTTITTTSVDDATTTASLLLLLLPFFCRSSSFAYLLPRLVILSYLRYVSILAQRRELRRRNVMQRLVEAWDL